MAFFFLDPLFSSDIQPSYIVEETALPIPPPTVTSTDQDAVQLHKSRGGFWVGGDQANTIDIGWIIRGMSPTVHGLNLSRKHVMLSFEDSYDFKVSKGHEYSSLFRTVCSFSQS